MALARQRSRMAIQPTAANDPEYSIYVYHHAESRKDGQNDWEKKRTTTDFARALDEARKLGVTGEYKKIELKKKYYDSRADCNLETTLQSFGVKPEKRGAILVTLGVICALALCAAIAMVIEL